MALTLVLGVLIGVIMGLTGAGGGILAVPALAAGLGWSMQQAAPVALIAVVGGATLGVIEGLRKGLVRYKAAMLMVLCGIPLTTVGLRIAHQLPQVWLLGLFALVMLIVAVRMLRQAHNPQEQDENDALALLNPDTGRFHWTWKTGFLFAGIGAFTGFMTGLLGVGGGFVIVPALRRTTNVSMHGIVATSLMVVALVGLGSISNALLHGAQLPMPATGLFTLALAGGLLLGRQWITRLPAAQVQRGFAILLVLVASGLLYKAAHL